MSLTAFLTNSDLPLAKEILDNIYVYNVFLNASTIQEALAKIESSRALFANIGMNLREFSSNSAEVNAGIPQQARCMAKHNKLLGVKYDTITDSLSLTIPFLPKRHVTKRELVSDVHKLYDPLGLVAPLSLRARMLMRDAVMLKAGWNKPLDPEFLHEWNELCLDISGTVVTIPRSIGSNSKNTGNATLWVFGDASQVAISCCYVSHPPENDTKGLLCAKTRLAPQQRQLPIPRLELLAILISVRLAKTIVTKYRHRLKAVHIVSDSKIALAWRQSSRKLPLFVENQVDRIRKIEQSIRDLAISVEYFHTDSEQNLADLATRPTSKEQFENSSWLTGPPWFSLPRTKWSVEPMSDESWLAEEENRGLMRDSETCAPALKSHVAKSDGIVDLRRFRHYSHALKTLTRAMKALSRWVFLVSARRNKHITTEIVRCFDSSRETTAEEMKLSENIILRKEVEHIDINVLQSKHKDKRIFYDENHLIRVQSRLTNAASLLPKANVSINVAPVAAHIMRFFVPSERDQSVLHRSVRGVNSKRLSLSGSFRPSTQDILLICSLKTSY
ncbi:hypothetical protein NECAME_02054 [Necator americanus]|uniref:Pao retrotransposon peptidase n=1 Tax=Necator americanus TaxID=51031 RepID=W2TJJ1_NECAM|nr:hypothetical protein NECAME_02054 [Necator americanus]ETN81764.1 hypothetical protein NECAME_02054 [Necator americanus]